MIVNSEWTEWQNNFVTTKLYSQVAICYATLQIKSWKSLYKSELNVIHLRLTTKGRSDQDFFYSQQEFSTWSLPSFLLRPYIYKNMKMSVYDYNQSSKWLLRDLARMIQMKEAHACGCCLPISLAIIAYEIVFLLNKTKLQTVFCDI